MTTGMDILTIILRTVRQTVESTGVPPDAVQTALDDAERRLRSTLGGSAHHISRIPSTKARIVELSQQGLTAQQISQRLGVTDRYVRRVVTLIR